MAVRRKTSSNNKLYCVRWLSLPVKNDPKTQRAIPASQGFVRHWCPLVWRRLRPSHWQTTCNRNFFTFPGTIYVFLLWLVSSLRSLSNFTLTNVLLNCQNKYRCPQDDPKRGQPTKSGSNILSIRVTLLKILFGQLKLFSVGTHFATQNVPFLKSVLFKKNMYFVTKPKSTYF